MMENFDLQLLNIENILEKKRRYEWKKVIGIIQILFSKYSDNVEVTIRILYILHNILLEKDYTEEEAEEIIKLLKDYFVISYQKFDKNSEYLFFMGIILHVADWYFGIDDDEKPMDQKLAFQMQKRAFSMEPSNILYRWAFKFSNGEKNEAYLLSKQILFGNMIYLPWLIKKGFAGKYVIGTLEYCYKNCLN